MSPWLFAAFVCALICGAIATNKNRHAFGWALIGLVFGPLAILTIAAEDPLPPFVRVATPKSASAIKNTAVA